MPVNSSNLHWVHGNGSIPVNTNTYDGWGDTSGKTVAFMTVDSYLWV